MKNQFMDKQLPIKSILRFKKKKMIIAILLTMMICAWLKDPEVILSKCCIAFIFLIIYLITVTTWNLWGRLMFWLAKLKALGRRHKQNT